MNIAGKRCRKSHFCSFELQRQEGNAFSDFSSFPQFLVMLRIPSSLLPYSMPRVVD
jgi:hypothetical protein